MELKGSELHREDQKHVLAAYVHRFTKEHRPGWIYGQQAIFPVQFESDKEWLENTLFNVKKNNRLDMRHHRCISTPTWPNNPEMRIKCPF